MKYHPHAIYSSYIVVFGHMFRVQVVAGPPLPNRKPPHISVRRREDAEWGNLDHTLSKYFRERPDRWVELYAGRYLQVLNDDCQR